MEKLDIKNIKFDQLGYVYKDIEKAAKSMENRLGIKQFTIFPPTPHEMIYREKPTTMVGKLAVANLFNIQIELIQWIEGNCIYKEFIEQGNEGLHHFRFECDDLDVIIDTMKEDGYKVLQQGRIVTISYAYFDTVKDFGTIIEFGYTKRRGKGKTI